MGWMHKTRMFGTLALALLAGVTACDRSNEIDADAAGMATDQQLMQPPEMSPELMAKFVEIQQIQQQLEPIQQQALEDQALAAQLAALQVRIETAMREEGSELFERIDRFEADMAAAEAAEDRERVHNLMMQAQSLQQEVQMLQASVFERDEIRAPLQEFEAAQRAAMIEIDPEAEALLDRVEALMAELPRQPTT
jgi:prefoldin subunit 5